MKQAALLLSLLLLSLPPRAAASGPQPCQEILAQPHAQLQRCGNISVLYLRGKPVERARAMGEMLRGPLSPELIQYFSDKIMDAMHGKPPLVRGIFSLAYNQVVRLLHRLTPSDLAEETDAMAAGMGIDPIRLRRAISLPDMASTLNALGSLPLLRSLPSAGCTSVAVRGPEGGFFYGRNLDFAGAELWDKYPLITVLLPEAGSGELRHAVFAADGVLFGGITGANEAGITFAVHQNYTRDAGVLGVPMMYIGEQVLRRARSLEEAEGILRRLRPSVLWTFVVTDLKQGRAIAVESSRNHFHVRQMKGNALAQTNHAIGAGPAADEYSSLGTSTNSRFREDLALNHFAGTTPPTLESLVEVLGYQESPDGEITAYRDVLKAHTIQTILFEGRPGTTGIVYVSADPAPTATGRYEAFGLAQLFAGPSGLRYEMLDPARTPHEKRQRQREISQAFHQYFDRHDIPAALSLLAPHRTLDAELFRATAYYQQSRYEESILTVNQALANPRFLGEPLYIRQSFEWVKIASLWRLGRRAEARSLAATLADAKPANRRHARILEDIRRGKNPGAGDLSLAFEFFSGDLSGRAD